MDLLNEIPVTLVIKAPNQKVADQTVECALNWTVRKLKEHLARVYPSNPTENQQKIIYSGKLLQDDVTLKDVLREGQSETVHTVHLVCCNSSTDGSTSQNIANTSSSSTVTSTEGLRNRRTAISETRQQQQENIAEQQQQQIPDQSSSIPTNVTERLHLPSSSAFQPQYHNPFMSAYLPPNAADTTAQTPANNAAYSMEQMMWMQQQAYLQYMTSYMQLFQQGTATMAQPYNQLISPYTPTPANQDAAQDQAAVNAVRRPAQPQQPPVVRMNAQGGPVADDDDEIERDWLDWFYAGVRFALLMCILYFYSTPTRFIVTFLLMLFIYLFQVGWFRVFVRVQREPPAAAVNPPPPPPPPPANPNEQPDDTTPNDAGATTAPEEPRPPGGLALAWSVFVAFFTSLAPQPPPPVNAN